MNPLLARCLANRGLCDLESASEFLHPRLRSLRDPFELPDLQKAARRLWTARARGEPIVIFGDYDVDGITATAILYTALSALGWRVKWYLPRRLEEGYGLTREAVANCLDRSPARILLAVDCGSTAVETIRWLQEREVETIVLDHHQISNPPPPAHAVVNPQRRAGENPPAPGIELCSAGLAFKLIHGLLKEGRAAGVRQAWEYDLKPLLDLVALGSVADMVPLVRENRIFVANGLRLLNNGGRPGLRILGEVAQVSRPIRSYEIAFQVAPRLNAAGRLEDASEAFQLLLAEDSDRARALAENLDQKNRERQALERDIAEEAAGSIRKRFDPKRDYAIVEGSPGWHIGVVGIVASRILQEFYRPTVILGGEGAELRGSGRSVEGFDLAAALRRCDDLLIRHGGHAMAAGVTVRPENLTALRERLNRIARQTLRPELLLPPLRLDLAVGLSELTVESVRELERLHPIGQGNPPVQLLVPRLRLARPPTRIGRDQQHLKFFVTDGREVREVIWWGGALQGREPSGLFDIACAPQVNEFNGRVSVQLRLLDWRPARR